MASRTETEVINEEQLKRALQTEINNGELELYKTGECYDILFKATNRYYEIDEKGNIEGGEELVIDNHPGDIMKDIHGNVLEGTEEKPYEINCIEDLVAFSNIVNGMGYKIENGAPVAVTPSNILNGKHVVLKRKLNFQSKFSYTNYTRTDFGDINGNLDDGNELLTEMTTGKGFRPIGYKRVFSTNFDGKNYKIKNIYIHYTKEEDNDTVAFITRANNATIKNVQLTGNIFGLWHAGGIVGDTTNVNIENCVNYANLTGYNMVGGIAARGATLLNCINYGNVYITGMAYSYGGGAGIIAYTDTNIEKCQNYGEIKGKGYLSGIVATGGNIILKNNINYGNIIEIEYGNITGGIMAINNSRDITIINCGNKGTIKANKIVGGIIGYIGGSNWNTEAYLNIQNCYNTGEIISIDSGAGGILGEQTVTAAKCYVTIENTWNTGEVTGVKAGGIQGKVLLSNNTDTKTQYNQVYYTNAQAVPEGVNYEGEAIQKTEEEIKSQEFVNILNQNIGEHIDWKKWKLGENGEPTFE